jgi:hypothetical protein
MRRQLEALRQEQAQLEAQVQEQVTGWLAPGAAANACPDTAACPDTSRRPPQAARTPPPPPPPPPRPQIKAARAQLDAPPVTPQEVAERRFKARMEVEESCRQASAPGGGAAMIAWHQLECRSPACAAAWPITGPGHHHHRGCGSSGGARLQAVADVAPPARPCALQAAGRGAARADPAAGAAARARGAGGCSGALSQGQARGRAAGAGRRAGRVGGRANGRLPACWLRPATLRCGLGPSCCRPVRSCPTCPWRRAHGTGRQGGG